ncbi:M4 family metallopeptidase [Emticicia sp.]|uniref:M4 family metallopeptidase n=1 Tax=Emticicia sp. TaxID=1930953 RepID=UPI0037513945
MRLIFIFISFAAISSFAQKGFDKKGKTATGKNETPQGQFIEIQGDKNDKNIRQSSITGLSTKFISKLKITRDTETGGVLMIENLSKASPKARKSTQLMAVDFLGEVKNALKIEDTGQELEMIKMETDEIGMTHIQILQKYKNLPVYGGEIWLHTKGEKIDVLNGRNFPTPKLNSTNPGISEEKAIEFAMLDVAQKSIVQQAQVTGKMLVKQQNTAELIVYHKDEKFDNERLTYLLSIRPNLLERWTYFVDANTGEILKKFNNTCALDGPFTATAKDLNSVTRTFNIQQVSNTYYMVDTQRPMYNKTTSKLPDDPIGAIWTIDAKNTTSDNMSYVQNSSTTGSNWSATAVSAHFNAGLCYDYYRTKFGRNSLDGKGGNIISVINIADDDGKGMDNAYWNGEFMGYGNGRDAFKPLAGALDVGGHEMTHGVVEATARLEYQNQSGALNESFADIFGAMIDRDDWTLGEDIVKTSAFPSGALRSLSNPNQGGKNDPGYQPKTMSQYAFLANTEDEDNGGVHVNSGIPNYAFYLFASNANVTKDKAEQVYYRVLTKYMTRTSKFVDARLAVVRASADLYGENSAVVVAAKAAFDAVGIADPNGGTSTTPTTTPAPAPTPAPQQNIPINSGGDFILVFEPSSGKLYTGKATDTNFKVISSSGCLSKPSVTDDGLTAYFVGKDKIIRKILLSGAYTETKVTSDAIWGNVTVSKDGKRLAALTKAGDKFMYVINLEDNKRYKFTLYNPTYSTGVSTGEVQYADSFEWDYTGESIIYDAFNSLKSISGNIEFWDVGMMKAWDLTKKTVGTGKIEKLFTDLEAGESIGNPSFSKNTQNIVAFDYFTEDEPNTYYQIGVDLSNNDLDAINKNNDIGYPGYSRLDDKMLFNTLNGKQQNVNIINLDKNKISPSGSAKGLFTDASWAVWYAQGARAIPTKTDQTINFSAISDKNIGEIFTIAATSSSNLVVQFTIDGGDITLNSNKVTVGTTAGKAKIKAFQLGNSQFNTISLTQTFCIIPTAPKIATSGNNLVASGGKNYQWYINGNLVGGQTTSTSIAADLGGTYTVRAITDDGCQSLASNSIAVAAKVLGTELDESIKVGIYPNPTADELRIELPAGIVFKEAKFYSISGSNVMNFDKLSSNNSLNISQLAKGMYSIKIETSRGSVSRKIVRE